MLYFDVALDAEVIGFSPQQVLEVPWGVPDWVTAEGRVLVGQAIWVIESGGRDSGGGSVRRCGRLHSVRL